MRTYYDRLIDGDDDDNEKEKKKKQKKKVWIYSVMQIDFYCFYMYEMYKLQLHLNARKYFTN